MKGSAGQPLVLVHRCCCRGHWPGHKPRRCWKLEQLPCAGITSLGAQVPVQRGGCCSRNAWAALSSVLQADVTVEFSCLGSRFLSTFLSLQLAAVLEVPCSGLEGCGEISWYRPGSGRESGGCTPTFGHPLFF